MCWLARRSEKSEYPPDLPITSIISGISGEIMNKFSDDIIEIIKNNKHRNTSGKLKSKVESALASKGYDVKIEWVYTVVVKQNTKALVVCNHDNHAVFRSVSDLAKGKYECSVCIAKKWEDFANSKGYTIDNREGSMKLSLSCITCGTKKCCTISAIFGVSGLICETCKKNEYTARCEECDLNYISHESGHCRTSVSVSCKMCGSTYDVAGTTLMGLQKNNCAICQENKKVENANLKGWLFTGLTNGGLQEIECKICSCKRLCSTNLINGKSKIICKECRFTKYRNALRLKNCTFIGLKKNPLKEGNLVIYKNEYNIVLQSDIGAVLSGNFCSTMDTHWTVPYKLYAIEVEYNNKLYHKIGIARNPDQRAKTLKIDGSYSVYILSSFVDRFIATDAEKYLHSTFEKSSLNKEYVASFCSNYVYRKGRKVLDGSTEWFCSLTVDSILKRFEDKYGIDRDTEVQTRSSRY